HSATGHGGRADRRPADGRAGMAVCAVVVRLQRPGPQHPGRAAPLHGGPRGGQGRARGAGCVPRVERFPARGRHGVDPRGAGRARLTRKAGRMPTSRLEAFSDGVLAIIITIMVLELTVPEGHTVSDLIHTTGIGLLSYLLSFVYVGIYWNNH